MIKKIQNPRNINFCFKISKRQLEEIEKIIQASGNILSKSILGYLGLEAIITILKEMRRAAGDNDEFRRLLLNPSTLRAGGFSYKPLISNLPLKERLEFQLMIEAQKNNKNKREVKE